MAPKHIGMILFAVVIGYFLGVKFPSIGSGLAAKV